MKHFRTEPTIVEKALAEVPGFQKVFRILEQQTAIRGQSKSTLNNYMRRIATICIIAYNRNSFTKRHPTFSHSEFFCFNTCFFNRSTDVFTLKLLHSNSINGGRDFVQTRICGTRHFVPPVALIIASCLFYFFLWVFLKFPVDPVFDSCA